MLRVLLARPDWPYRFGGQRRAGGRYWAYWAYGAYGAGRQRRDGRSGCGCYGRGGYRGAL